MNKYLIEILKLRTSVTLPGFGALMIANSKTGKIVLNQLLKYDDKVLAKFIAEKENIDLQEAQNRVSQFIKEIDLDLSKGETYDIFKFGKLSKTENGSIVFEMDDVMKKEQVLPIASSTKPEPKVEKSIVSIPEPEVKPVVEKKGATRKVEMESTEESQAITPKVEKKKEVVKPEEKEVPKNVYTPPVVPKVEKVEKPTPKIDKKVESKEIVVKAEPKILTAKEKAKQEKEANKKWQKTQLGDKEDTKKRKLWPWVVVLLLIAIGVGVFIFQDKLKDILGSSADTEKIEDVKVEDVVSDDVVAMDTLNVEFEEVEVLEEPETPEEIIEEEVIEPVTNVQTSTTGSYHIIGGAFGEEANANAFATKTGGIVLGRFNGVYQVAVKSYNTRTEVNSAFSSVSSEYTGAWVFKYPK